MRTDCSPMSTNLSTCSKAFRFYSEAAQGHWGPCLWSLGSTCENKAVLSLTWGRESDVGGGLEAMQIPWTTMSWPLAEDVSKTRKPNKSGKRGSERKIITERKRECAKATPWVLCLLFLPKSSEGTIMGSWGHTNVHGNEAGAEIQTHTFMDML